jgi:Tfp pilus assembly protein PilN
MRAINLIPLEERRGTVAASRSGGLVYVLLGALTLLAALAAMYGVAAKATHDKRAALADVTARAAAAERTAHALAGYTDFAAARRQRTEAVKALAARRVDWAHALSELARTMPSHAWLTSLHATSGVPTAGATTATPAPSLGGSAPTAAPTGAPTIELQGCTTAQSAVSQLLADLRRVDGVAAVRLASSTKSATSSTSGSTASGSVPAGPCAVPGRVTFALTLSFRAKAAPAAAPTTATAGSTP